MHTFIIVPDRHALPVGIVRTPHADRTSAVVAWLASSYAVPGPSYAAITRAEATPRQCAAPAVPVYVVHA